MFGGASWFLWADTYTAPGGHVVSWEEYEAGVEAGRYYETNYEHDRNAEAAGERFGPSRLAGAAGERSSPFGLTLDDSLLSSPWEAAFSRGVPGQPWDQAFGGTGRDPILGEGNLP